MSKEKITENEVLEMLANDLTIHLIFLMEKGGKKINKEEAENMLYNVAVYLIKKQLK